jgi:hypothetical protein
MTMQSEKIRTIHVYFEEFTPDEQPEAAKLSTTIEADPDPDRPEPTRYKMLGLCCGLFLCLLCVVIPVLATLLPQVYQDTYDTSISRTVTLTLSQHPATGQVQVYTLAQIKKSEQLTVTATGSLHQNATQATGLITFYNGLFTPQTVPAGATLKGKDGIAIVTSQSAVIPAATATTPPTYGTISVTAYSAISGELGNIAGSDIDQACCGSSILAQNLYAFSGGQNAKDIPVLTKTDLSMGTQTVTSQVSTAINDLAQGEIQPGYILLPLDCKTTLSANHSAGDHVGTAILTLTEVCTPLAYFAPDIAFAAQQRITIPKGYHLVSFSALVAQSNVTSAGGTLTVQAVAYLKQNTPIISPYHFAGK